VDHHEGPTPVGVRGAWFATRLAPGADRGLVIAEVGQAHDGSLGLAHAFIDAIADAGADVVKFQTHIAAAESTPQEPWRIRFSRQDVSRYEYWKRMEFREADWLELRRHAESRGLQFLSSPFSLEAVELLTRIGVGAWKIPSGELTNPGLLDAVIRTGLPILLSTGMGSFDEIDRAVRSIRRGGNACAVLQCTTAYPCPPEQIGLNVLEELRSRYDCPVGLSDHSGTIFPGLSAATLGANVIEVHVTLSREMFGPDVTSSLTTQELRTLVDGVRFIERMRRSPVEKDGLARELAPLRDLFQKSVVVRTALPAGTVLRPEHLAAKKPGTGIPAAQMATVIGSRLTRSMGADEVLQAADIARVE
jgi:N,N'-diacetyllegionaminate synthase